MQVHTFTLQARQHTVNVVKPVVNLQSPKLSEPNASPKLPTTSEDRSKELTLWAGTILLKQC